MKKVIQDILGYFKKTKKEVISIWQVRSDKHEYIIYVHHDTTYSKSWSYNDNTKTFEECEADGMVVRETCDMIYPND